MAEQITRSEQAIEQARDAAAREAWADVYGALRDLDPGRTAPGDSLYSPTPPGGPAVSRNRSQRRTKAYSGYVAAGAARQAGFSAWMLFLGFSWRGVPPRRRAG